MKEQGREAAFNLFTSMQWILLMDCDVRVTTLLLKSA